MIAPVGGVPSPMPPTIWAESLSEPPIETDGDAFVWSVMALVPTAEATGAPTVRMARAAPHAQNAPTDIRRIAVPTVDLRA